jgi:hypothetical protein
VREKEREGEKEREKGGRERDKEGVGKGERAGNINSVLKSGRNYQRRVCA